MNVNPWVEIVRTDGQGPDPAAMITLMRNAMAFSARFVRSSPKVEAARFITFLVDDEARRLGFRFTSEPEDNSLTLTPNGRKRNTVGRIVQAQALMTRYPWIRSAAEVREVAARRYKPTWDSIHGLFFVTLRPTFERVAKVPLEIPTGIIGLYRYCRGDVVVYIGHGDIRAGQPDRSEKMAVRSN